jgi:gliding-associated putative ABC transporter substrate-binding component GldG
MADPKKKKSGEPNRGARKGAESVGYLLITLVVIVLANVAGYFVYERIDLTESRRYSLSQGSERLVSSLDDTMEITAYFTSDLPPPFNTTERYVRNLLEEYEAASGGKLQVRFVDPDEEEEQEEAQQAGVREVQHQAIENDSVSVKTGYRGLVIRYLGDRETIPVIQDTQGLEYEITQAIRQLVRDPLPVGVVSGHGSPSLEASPGPRGQPAPAGLSTLRGALPHYELQEVDVSEEIDPDLRALLIVAPTESFSEEELRHIDQYVMRGGSLGIFGGSMNVSLEGMAPTASPADTGLDRLLSAWGVEMGEALVADARCGRVPMRTAVGIPIPVAYPPAPIVTFTEDEREHPVLFRLNQAPFFFTSPIETTDTFHELNGTVLGTSSEDASWLLTGDTIQLRPRDPREWTIGGQTGPHKVMVALSGQLPSAFAAGPMSSGEEEASDIEAPAQSEEEVRVLVAGSGALLQDQFLPSREQSRGQMTGGLALALNAVDWLAADADLIAIRAKNIEDPALDVPQDVRTAEQEIREAAEEAAQTGDESGIEEARARHEEAMDAWETKKWTYRLSIIGGVPLLIILFGLLRWNMRKNKRANLQELRKRLEANKS